jgi:hypothetical protein
MNPMKLVLQNLKEPLPTSDPNLPELTQYVYIDQKILSKFMSIDANIPIHLSSGPLIQIQTIQTFRGVDIASANINFDELNNGIQSEPSSPLPNHHLQENVLTWIPCENASSAILSINIDMLRLLTKELQFTAEKWMDILQGKTINNERHLVQVYKRMESLLQEGNSFFFIKDIGIVRPFQQGHFLQYLYGPTMIRNFEIDPKYVHNYEMYLEEALKEAANSDETEEAEENKNEELLKAEEEEIVVKPEIAAKQTTTEDAVEVVENHSEIDSGARNANKGQERPRTPEPTVTTVANNNTNNNNSLSPNIVVSKAKTLTRLGSFTAQQQRQQQDLLAASQPQNLDFEERDDMTLAERRDLRKRKEEYEKQRKLKEFLRVEGDSSQFLPSVQSSNKDQENPDQEQGGSTKSTANNNGNKKGSVKDRFLIAQQQQQEQESERLAKFKNDPNKKINPHNITTDGGRDGTQVVSSVRSKWNEGIPAEDFQQHPQQPHASVVNLLASSGGGSGGSGAQDTTQNKNKLRSKWENALQDTKNTEVTRFQTTKQSTIAQFRITHGTGIVKRRIEQWEELFLQIAASAEQLEEFLSIAQSLSEQKDYHDGLTHDQLLEMQANFVLSCQQAEDFVINDTHIYSSRLFSAILHSLLKKCLAESKTPNHFTLSCGVYGETGAQKPPIDVFAFAIKTHQNKIYIALTVKAALGKDLDINVYGLKKVMVFIHNPKDQSKTNIFEKLLNILPQPGWEGWMPEQYHEEMRAIINYNKTLLASRNNSFYNSTSDHKSASLDDFNELGIETVVTESFDDEIMKKSKSRDEQQLKEEEMLQVKDQERDEQEDPRDIPLDNHLPDEDNVLSAPEQPTTEEQEREKLKDPLEETETLDAMDEILAGDPDPVSHLNKRISTSSNLPDDEGEGTWTQALTPQHLKNALPPLPEEDDSSSAVAVMEPVTLLENTQYDNNDSMKGRRDSEEGDDVDEDVVKEEQFVVPHPTGGRGRGGSHKPGEFSDDEADMDDDDDDDATQISADDDNEEHYHFGKSPVLVSATVARVFSATPLTNSGNAFMKSKHNQAKFSWPVEAELEENLETGQHSFAYLNLRDVKTTSATSNFFLIQSKSSTAVFTGTLAHGTTETNYLLEGDKVFEWIRGAAASGWCWKFPMKTQSFGRIRKRFFILRDNILSYHKHKPLHEEDVASTFSHNTLHLTDNSSITIGRKRLQKCLIITTPFDTLWLKMKRDFTTEAVKWIGEFNKAIQFFGRREYFYFNLFFFTPFDFYFSNSEIDFVQSQN